MTERNADESRGLRRQSILIAILCAVGDGILFALVLVSSPAAPALSSPLLWIAGVLVLLADLALALPARTATQVAVLHGCVRLVCALLLWQASGIPDFSTGNATGLAVAGYRAGAWSVGRRSSLALGALAAGMGAAQFLPAPQGGLLASAAVITVANTLLPWLMGRYTTGRAGYIEQIERAADEQRRHARAELEQAMVAQRGAIARDLHDTISHHVSAIGIHAAAGRLALSAQPDAGSPHAHDAATRALDQVETSSGAAMTDLRRMLDLLAADDADDVRQPGLADLATLVDGSRAAGLTVTLSTSELLLALLPQSLQLAAYRVIQEMLTNALRHGDGVLDLVLNQDETQLVITATNGLAPSRNPGTGRGLDGIQQRARVFGGRAQSQQRGDQWVTRVSLPLVAS